ncbi:stage II sporulation protein M [Alkalihalobacillus trypoxylicola]|uniref:Stage II sporulation protein M n=1 Tax=Alkalihalobacillus trypoxylicola TaxID=519424 RepID=A0A161PE11_9BACI|nr:stage II sporulation protein M [Alkalihalobacillus trypoxylicola]KYG30698.1 stage II sporulation protein M [Alkalihalobacillus trypoxylicola]
MRTTNLKDLISAHLEENKSIYVFTIVLFIMGIIFGAIIVNSMSLTQKHDLYMYLTQFFGQVSNGHVAESSDIFSKSFIHYAKYIGLMWLLGLSIIGLPIIFVILFLKGVVVGFTVGFLVNQLGFHGFLLSFASIMPQNFILIPAFIIVGATSAAFCIRLIRQQFLKQYAVPIFPMFMRYSLLILCVGAAVAFAAVIEGYLSPSLMRMVITYSL